MATKKATKKATDKTSAKATGGEPQEFKAEVAKLLQLMVHSVYSEREIFLRELISNASDACDKLRYLAIAEPDLMATGGDLRITIEADKPARVLSISDSGIGMDEDELAGNLGTIARSGTQAFMESARGKEGDVNLIGQFGVGFYSAFMVAERVEVISHKAGGSRAWKWSSDGSGTFTVEPVEAGEAPQRGTTIRLHLRSDAEEFLDGHRLETIVRTYSDHVPHPIMLAIDDETARQINSASAIWTRPKSEITEDQYKEFFGHVSGVFSDPALTLHYRAEGRHEYTVLLFVPGERPFDLFDPGRSGRQKLYVQRVFITDDAEILPAYLRFVRGVIDSQDMPLNISREMLQDNPIVAQIRKAVTNKVLGELAKCAEKDPETYAKIWQAFGAVLKEGLYEDMERRDQLFEIARFRSTASEGETVSLKDYVGRLKENQTAIYYLAAEDARRLAHSPQIEGFRARGIEVLLLSDPVDSFWVRTALGYEGKPFRSVTQGVDDLASIPMKDGDAGEAADAGKTATLVAALKTALGDEVKDVRVSDRLTSSPVCLVADNAGLDRTLEKLLARQNTTAVEISKPILEINPRHGLIKALAGLAGTGKDALDDAARLLLDQAYVLEGETPADPEGFSRRLSAVMTRALERA